MSDPFAPLISKEVLDAIRKQKTTKEDIIKEREFTEARKALREDTHEKIMEELAGGKGVYHLLDKELLQLANRAERILKLVERYYL